MKLTLLALTATLATASAHGSSHGHHHAARDVEQRDARIPNNACGPVTVWSQRNKKCVQKREDADGNDTDDPITTSDQVLSEELAKSLAEDEEDYDQKPDGMTDEEYYEDLKAKDADDGGELAVEKRGVWRFMRG